MLLQFLLPSASVGIVANVGDAACFGAVKVVQKAQLSGLLGETELNSIVILILTSKTMSLSFRCTVTRQLRSRTRRRRYLSCSVGRKDAWS